MEDASRSPSRYVSSNTTVENRQPNPNFVSNLKVKCQKPEEKVLPFSTAAQFYSDEVRGEMDPELEFDANGEIVENEHDEL